MYNQILPTNDGADMHKRPTIQFNISVFVTVKVLEKYMSVVYLDLKLRFIVINCDKLPAGSLKIEQNCPEQKLKIAEAFGFTFNHFRIFH